MKFHFSPSLHHRHLLSETVPSLAYRGGGVKKWQAALRRKLGRLLGDWPEERCRLNPRRIWLRDPPMGTIEKGVFTSEPFSDVAAYACLPSGSRAPYTFMICLQGHTTGMHQSIAVQQDDESLPMEVAGDRDFAIGCMSRGIAALCIEQRAFGERLERVQKQVSPLGCMDATLQALMLGRTLIGERVYDIDRAIDYLAARGDDRQQRQGQVVDGSHSRRRYLATKPQPCESSEDQSSNNRERSDPGQTIHPFPKPPSAPGQLNADRAIRAGWRLIPRLRLVGR